MATHPPDELARALASQADTAGVHVSDEELAILASGEVDLLSDSDRRRVLDAVAADPELGEVVLQSHRALSALQAQHGGTSPQVDTPGGASPKASNSRGPVLYRFVSVGWALAACMTLGTGVIFFGQGTGDTGPGYPLTESVKVEASAPFDPSSQSLNLIKLAFFGCAGATLILSAPMIWRFLRRGARQS